MKSKKKRTAKQRAATARMLAGKKLAARKRAHEKFDRMIRRMEGKPGNPRARRRKAKGHRSIKSRSELLKSTRGPQGPVIIILAPKKK